VSATLDQPAEPNVSAARVLAFTLACALVAPFAVVLSLWTPIGLLIVLTGSLNAFATFRAHRLGRLLRLGWPALAICESVSIWSAFRDDAAPFEYALIAIVAAALVSTLAWFESLF
jgi:hypothetical protein